MKRTIKLTKSKLRDMIQEAVNGAMAQRKPLKKVQPKRLTEGRLRDMIKESVRTALNEMDDFDYGDALKQHPNLMSKVDPRTFANRTRGVNAQGKPRRDDRDTMQHAAVSAWNRDYGHNGTNHYNQTWDSTYMDNDGDYTVYDNNGSYADTVNGNGGQSMQRQYDPKTNTLNYQHRQFDLYGKTIPNKTQSGTIKNGMGSDIGRQVANQMANGKGKYVKGKGWQ